MQLRCRVNIDNRHDVMSQQVLGLGSRDKLFSIRRVRKLGFCQPSSRLDIKKYKEYQIVQPQTINTVANSTISDQTYRSTIRYQILSNNL